ncbi:carbohydrate-binding protein [Streptomyces sp. NPDC002004]
MTAGNNGASTPENEDPFGYLYADGQASGATPPSGGGGYGYPGPRSVNRVRTVGDRQYGQQGQTAAYGQAPTAAYGQVPQQGRPNPHYQAPETLPGGAPRQSPPPSGGRGRGPNTKGLLIGAVAVVAVVVIGIGVAVLTGGKDNKGTDDQAGSGPAATQSSEPTDNASNSSQAPGELPKSDAKALKLSGATTASDIPGAKSAGGVYVGNFNQPGASATWTVSVPKSGDYTLFVGYGVPGKAAKPTLTVNSQSSNQKLNMDNFAHAPEGAWDKGWTKTFAWISLNKGTNTLTISCESGDQCDFNLDQVWLKAGHVKN